MQEAYFVHAAGQRRDVTHILAAPLAHYDVVKAHGASLP
jgi:hypothetical protein